MKRLLSVLLLTAWSLQAAAGPDRLEVAAFSRGELAPWEPQVFQGHTEYRLMEEQGRRFLRAHARASASGLVRRIRVDLDRTPWLHWSWRVHRLPPVEDEHSRSGDDFAARVYVIIDGGWAFWRTRSLSWVWSARQSAGAVWPNPYTANVIMVAARGREDALGEWREERVNLAVALARHLGRPLRWIDAVAVMTDADDSGGEAMADYGDIWFSAGEEE